MSKETGLKSIAEGRSDILKIDPRKLQIKAGWNNRNFDDPANIEHVDMLAQSIKEVGVKEPLTVYWENNTAWVSDGECRLRATLRAIEVYKADIKTVPVKTEDRYANEADRLFSQQLRNSGKPFTPLENAKLYKRLIDLGWQAKDIALKSGVTPSRISQTLALLTLPVPVQEMVVAGTVSASLAVQKVKEHEGNPAKATQELRDAVVVAQQEGKTRAMPKHMGEGKEKVDTKANYKTVLKEAFDNSDIDNEFAEDDFAVIKMPKEHWEKVRELLKL